MKRPRSSHIAELGLWIVSALCLGILAARHLSARTAAQTARQMAEARDAVQAANLPLPAPARIIGQMSIPALRLSIPISSDDEKADLLRGVGHIPGTALPGGLGTVGLAGHRDTYLRPLKDVRRGMLVQLADSEGTYFYSVDSTEIVKPEQTSVLNILSKPSLTIVTCYPFYYIGAAPRRFIVHAHLLSVVASAR